MTIGPATLIAMLVAASVATPADMQAGPSAPTGRQGQPSAPVAEHVAIGVLGAVGTIAPIGTLRLGVPLGRLAGFDLDFGKSSRDNPDASPTVVAFQVRLVRHESGVNGVRRYLFVGALHLAEVSHDTYQVGNKVTRVTSPVNGWSPSLGVGWDRRFASAARAGLELALGANESAGPRFLVKVFVELLR